MNFSVLRRRGDTRGADWESEIPMDSIFVWLSGGLCLACGAAAVVLRPKARVNWLFFFAMALLGAATVLEGRLRGASGLDIRLLQPALLVESMLPVTWLAFSLCHARGNAIAFLQRWKLALIIAVVAPAALVMALPGRIAVGAPDGAGGLHFLPWGQAWMLVLLLTSLAVLIQLEKTFRSAFGMSRWRLKYLVLGVAMIFGVRLYVFSQVLLFSSYDPRLGDLNWLAVMLGTGMIGISMARAGFGSSDLYPSRAALQGSVTVILAGGYFLVVGLFAKWTAASGIVDSFALQALILLVAAVALTVLLLSDRFRMGLQRWVSRHFRRPVHDFRRVWTEFTRRTSGAIESRAVARAAAEVIAEHFHALGVAVFRSVSAPDGLEALCLAGNPRAETMVPLPKEDLAEIASFSRPFPLEGRPQPWAEALRAACARKFDHGGDRLAVPLVAADNLIGLLVLSDRVNGVPYSEEELDLLNCIGDQLAGSLLNRALTEEVVQARELEAFRALSTFFVHDLKNASNSLGLMFQNLPLHFDDPEFREDAIRGVGRTVDRINRLIQKLGSLRHEPELKFEPARLDLLCAEVLDSQCMEAGGQPVVRDLQPVPLLPLDREAFGSVLTNLVVNGREAGGSLAVATRLEDGRIVLEVSDTGSGMTPEFVKRQLFRPFQSTKTHGLGIGMFQCKKIVESHGGTIVVESVPGQGTRFTIALPAAPRAAPISLGNHETENSDRRRRARDPHPDEMGARP